MTGRETAWRVFTAELQASRIEERTPGERGTSYVLTPAGARVSRALLAGTLCGPDLRGAAGEGVPAEATLTDATGTIPVVAGEFQPRGRAMLRAWTADGPCVLIGKPHLVRGRDGAVGASVRAEALRPVSAPELLELREEIAAQTSRRLALVEGLRRAAPLPEIVPEREPPLWAAAARAAVAAYPHYDTGPLRLALLHPSGGTLTSTPPAPRAPGDRPVIDPGGRPPASDGPSAADRAREAAFLDLVDELAESSADGCADLREVVQRAAGRGVRAAAAEELLHRLEASGVLEEPVAGKARRAGTPRAD